MAFGFAAASRSLWITLLLALLFLIIYAPHDLRRRNSFCVPPFPAFESYAQRVPRLLPRLTPAALPGGTVASLVLFTASTASTIQFWVPVPFYIVLVAALWLRH